MKGLPIVYHIHTDLKFAVEVKYFPSDKFENKYVILTNKSNIDSKCPAMIIRYSVKGAKQLIEIITKSNAKYVLLYDLNPIKAYIANRLPLNITIIWRFFGYELYEQLPSQMYAVEELSLYNRIKSKNSRDIISKIKRKVCWGEAVDVRKSFSRINYFMCLFEHEYEYLSKYFKLPPYLIIPRNYRPNFLDIQKDNTIVLGNNRGIYNNHLELLGLLTGIDSESLAKYHFSLLFNYGPENEYTESVIQESIKLPCVEVINEFMPLESFKALYQQTIALVINGYRQMAMGNIMVALQYGTKIYLNKKNSTYKWLLDHNFAVSPIENLRNDIIGGQVELSDEDKLRNSQQLLKLNEEYSVERFLSMLEE